LSLLSYLIVLTAYFSRKLAKHPDKTQYDDSQLNQGTISKLSSRDFRSDEQRHSIHFGPGGSSEWDPGSGAGNQRDESAKREQKKNHNSHETNRTGQGGRQPNNVNPMQSSSGGQGAHGNNSAPVKDGSLSGQVLARTPSLRTLHDRYNRIFEGSETFRTRYSDVFYYVQALRTQNSLVEAKWKDKSYELDQVFNRLLSVAEASYRTEVEDLRENGLTGARILDFVLNSYLTNSNMVINLSNQIVEAKQARYKAERELQKEMSQHSQDIEVLNKSHRQTLKDQQRMHEAAVELQQRSHAEERASLTANHSQEIHQLTTGHTKQIDVLTTAWSSQAAEFKATISRLQVALLRPVDSFEPLTDGNAENRLEDLRHLVRALARTSMEGVDHGLLGEAFGQTSFIQSEKKQARKYILESFLWTVVVDNFFAHPFSAFGDHGDSLSTTWTQLFETGRFGVLICK
jgi:hypothetical protein